MHKQKIEQSMTKVNWHNLHFWGFFNEAQHFGCHLSLCSGKRGPNQVDHLGQAILSHRHHRNSYLLRYIPENRCPRVVTGMWLLKNWKLTAMLKNKTWTSPQIKNHKESHELRHNTKSRTCVLKILNILVPSVVKAVNLRGIK
jgi:hypothetical protein